MKSVLPFRGDDTLMYSITYDLSTPESRELGSFEESGYIVEPTEGELQDILLEANRDYGIYKPVGIGSFTNTTADHDHDYFTKGHEKYYTLFINKTDGSRLNQEELDFITALLNEGKYSYDEESNRFYEWGGTPEYGIGGWIGGTLIGGFLGYQIGKAVGYGRAYRGYEDGGEIKVGDSVKWEQDIGSVMPLTHMGKVKSIEGDYANVEYMNTNRKYVTSDVKLERLSSTYAEGGEIIKEISTHKAVRNGDKIDIISKGFEIEDLKYSDEVLYSIPAENEEDLMSIFDNLQEENRILLAQANGDFSKGGSTYQGGGEIESLQKKRREFMNILSQEDISRKSKSDTIKQIQIIDSKIKALKGNSTYQGGGDIPEGFHKMPDGTIMPDSAHYGLGGLLLAGGFGAYIGYKVGRARPQKKGFDTEKKIARKIKSKFKYAGGGEILVVKTKKGLKTMRDFEDFSKAEIKEWGTERGWKYNSEGEKYGGQALKMDEFFVKPMTKRSVKLPKSYQGGGSIDDDLQKLQDTHEKIREILIENGNEEYGDFIIDDISEAVGISNTNAYYDEDEEYVKPTKVSLKGTASEKDLENLQEVHEKIREILIENGNEEYGDSVIDQISEVVGIPTTLAYYNDDEYEGGGKVVSYKYYDKDDYDDSVTIIKPNELKEFLDDWNSTMETNYKNAKEFNAGEDYYVLEEIYYGGGETITKPRPTITPTETPTKT